MEDLPEALVTEILKRITSTSDLNSLSLVSKQLYKIEGNQRGAIHVGSGLCTATKALTSLCARFPNLRKVEIDYSAYCKTLVSLRLNSAPKITSIGLFSVAVGCTSLSALHLIDCEKIDSVEWLEYLGRDGSLKELVVKNCKGVNHRDFLKFGSGWMKLQKFEFERKRGIDDRLLGDMVYDSSYNAHNTDIYDFCCESLKDLRFAHIKTWPEVGLRVVLGKCKALEKLCLETSFTDNSLYAIALNCPMLQIIDLRFTRCSRDWPLEIGFTQKGFLTLIQSRAIRVLVLNNANFFDEGMKAVSSSPHLETLELILCHAVTYVGMRFIAHTPCLSNLILRACHNITDVGMAELGRAHKLESLVIEYCGEISLQAAQGVIKSVHYSSKFSDALKKKLGFLGKC
ncbi:hypothetical protein CFC21_091554 [Triticum aestivum]|uniref:F-box domain-containing protein n=2 Tax=Triticum aestivum TaxID=4565 RepID=A0A9R1MT83_WHEAT|nr:hypothetical protein CFC21_091554 [Triticum aestivum]